MLSSISIFTIIFAATTATDVSLPKAVNDVVTHTNTLLSGGASSTDNHYFNFHTVTQSHSTVKCPNPNDASAIFELGTSSALDSSYPAQLVLNELGQRAQLATVLAQEIPSQSGTDLIVPVDPVFDNAQVKCKSVTSKVITFKSVQNRGVCWVIQGFQEPIFATNCVEPECKGCNSHDTNPSTSLFNDDFWKSLNIPNFSHFSNSVFPVYKNICAPRFTVRTIWAYCPLSSETLKIVREQIIIPQSCSCRRVRCNHQ